MKYILISICLFFIACEQNQQEKTSEVETREITEDSGFDIELAEKLKADDYGMAQYVIAFLKSGPNRTQDSTTRMQLQRAHLDNISRLAKEGKLLLAGPMMDNGDLRGIYVFDVESIEEAKKLTESDPAIQSGSLVMELHPWYGSASLRMLGEIHDKIAKVKI